MHFNKSYYCQQSGSLSKLISADTSIFFFAKKKPNEIKTEN